MRLISRSDWTLMKIRLLRFFLFIVSIVLMLYKKFRIFLIPRTPLLPVIFPQTFNEIFWFFITSLIIPWFKLRSKVLIFILIWIFVLILLLDDIHILQIVINWYFFSFNQSDRIFYLPCLLSFFLWQVIEILICGFSYNLKFFFLSVLFAHLIQVNFWICTMSFWY